MKDIIEYVLKEGWDWSGRKADDAAAEGNVLEIELGGDKGKFYWHTPTSEDWNNFKDLGEWKVAQKDPHTFYIRIGKIGKIRHQIK